jgi:hypothetical protein
VTTLPGSLDPVSSLEDSHSVFPSTVTMGFRVEEAPNSSMTARAKFTAEEARRIGEEVGIDWSSAPFDVEQFRAGLDVELEHGAHDPRTNVTDDDPTMTGKIAWAHLNEFPDYYTRLEAMEEQAKRDHGIA